MVNRLTDRPMDYEELQIFSDLEEKDWYYSDVMSASNIAIKKVEVK